MIETCLVIVSCIEPFQLSAVYSPTNISEILVKFKAFPLNMIQCINCHHAHEKKMDFGSNKR